jgi:uncharacterized membrane protein SpoIIM required for sporulation
VTADLRISPKLVLRSREFHKAREQSWRDLEALVERIENRGVVSLSPDELERLPSLYRILLSSLSVARSIALDRNLLVYLEGLALRSFLAVYGPRASLVGGFVAFLRIGFPRAVRAARWHMLVAAAMLALGTVVGFFLVLGDATWFAAFVPDSVTGDRGPNSTRDDLLGHEIFAPWPGLTEALLVFANFLFTHNSMIGIFAFGLGFIGGVPTLLLLFYQGLMLGAFLALHEQRGLVVEFLGWVSVHGVTELSAIILCGAAGLLIGEKMVFPGRYDRLENLAIHGRRAAQIAIGAVVMLLIAAALEGCFRQLVQSTPWRFIIGAASGCLWLTYFVVAGRERSP